MKTSRYGPCHRCGPDMKGTGMGGSGSVKYLEARRYLAPNDPLRFDTVNFPNVEFRGPPVPLSIAEWRYRAKLVEDGEAEGVDVCIHRWSEFYRLPYWQDLKVRWLLDPMHIEANLSKSIIKHLSGVVPLEKIIRDLREYWGERRDDEEGFLGQTPWLYDSDTLKNFNYLLSKTKFPTKYGPTFAKTWE